MNSFLQITILQKPKKKKSKALALLLHRTYMEGRVWDHTKQEHHNYHLKMCIITYIRFLMKRFLHQGIYYSFSLLMSSSLLLKNGFHFCKIASYRETSEKFQHVLQTLYAAGAEVVTNFWLFHLKLVLRHRRHLPWIYGKVSYFSSAWLTCVHSQFNTRTHKLGYGMHPQQVGIAELSLQYQYFNSPQVCFVSID